MATANAVLTIAAGDVGYNRWDDPLEGTISGRWYAAKTGQRYYGTSGVPYCAMEVSYVFDRAGMSIFGDGRMYAYCPYIVRDARAAGRLRSFDDILPGDVILFDWDEDGVADHVGFAVRRVGNYVHTIEGNTSPGNAGSQSNGGGVYRRVRHRSTICAVVRPAYDQAAPTPVSAPAAVQGAGLVVDGVIGPASIQALQRLMGTVVDGEISGQMRSYAARWDCAGAGWQFNDGNGSTCIIALQRRLGVTVDGYAGEQTIRALQKRLNVTVDGYAGVITGKALQRALNTGKL